MILVSTRRGKQSRVAVDAERSGSLVVRKSLSCGSLKGMGKISEVVNIMLTAFAEFCFMAETTYRHAPMFWEPTFHEENSRHAADIEQAV